MKLVLVTFGCFLIFVTFLSLSRSPRWWIRVTDFPRLQIAVCLAAVLLCYALLYGFDGGGNGVFLAAVAGALGYQGFRIFPYTILAPCQTKKAAKARPDASIRLLISNVLMENRRADAFLALVREAGPDLVLAVETDAWWGEQLKALDRDYPHSVKQPQGNYYGMHLFSKLELESPEVRFLVEKDVPSVRTAVRLRSGDWIDFFGVHPQPPVPHEDTEERDAEILIVAKEVRADDRPAIVAGDLNDVAWSHTTRLFQRVSGTLDPRRGRGMFSTFHTRYPFFRWPLDHIFHEASFTLVRLQRLRSIGSDHFPVLAELHYEPGAAKRQEAPEADHADRKEACEKVAEGKETAS
ncbi:endonuclease/exonuclease/phosphatase family protein [Chelativorans sp.]|uniref:endonuclease/exonuclease/phosphatase family protein n=1 Tax=Chelativorans sp. TaxID=2203393 RepID=UPI0028120F9A|nr:endonuclease/exonuclease/phosphatase family protein [Chelativorans sp.]